MMAFARPVLVQTKTEESQVDSHRLAYGVIAVPVQGKIVGPGSQSGFGMAVFFLCCDVYGNVEMIEAASILMTEDVARIKGARGDFD